MNRKKQILITWVIAVLAILVMVGYGAAMLLGASQQDVPVVVRGLLIAVSLAITAFIIMMIITAVRRKREIEEDDDDLGQY